MRAMRKRISRKSPKNQTRRLLRDPEIRRALVAELKSDDPEAVIFNELPLVRGVGRADVVAVNGSIRGYEIKSDCDSLARLRTQCAFYDHTCEYVTIVLTGKHLMQAKASVPESWGIFVVARLRTGKICIKQFRAAKYNQPLMRVLIRQLWKTECVKLLNENGLTQDRNASVRHIWQQMENLPKAALENGVRLALKRRQS
jgi:hypothetical protein